MGFTPWAIGTFGLVGQTAYPGGYTLINGTQNVPGLAWTAPNDGRAHFVMLVGQMVISLATTGGGIQATFTPPSGAQTTLQMVGGGLAAGARAFSNTVLMVAPGTTVTIAQSAAMTAGAGVMFAGLWAA